MSPQNLIRIALHALFFMLAVVLGIYGWINYFLPGSGVDIQAPATGDVATFVIIYLSFITAELFVRGAILAKWSAVDWAFRAFQNYMTTILAMTLFLWVAYLLGDKLENNFVGHLLFTVIFLVLETVFFYGIEIVLKLMFQRRKRQVI